MVELVGLEPTTRVLWNVGVSDQLTLSDTKHSSSKRPAIEAFAICPRSLCRRLFCADNMAASPRDDGLIEFFRLVPNPDKE